MTDLLDWASDLVRRYPGSVFWLSYVGYVAGVFQITGWLR